MLASQRKQQILQILAEEKQVMSGDLSQRFSVSEDSIRRDLRELYRGRQAAARPRRRAAGFRSHRAY